jgi:hypothetical protein
MYEKEGSLRYSFNDVRTLHNAVAILTAIQAARKLGG